MGRKRGPLGHLVPVIILYGLLIGGGFYKVLLESLGYIPALGMTDFTLDYYQEILGASDFLKNFLYTLYLSLTAASISLIFGVLIAFKLTRSAHPKVKKMVTSLMQFGMVLPYLYMIFIVVLLFSKTGIYSRILLNLGLISGLDSFPRLVYEPYGIGILLVFILKGTPFVTLFLLNVMSNISDNYEGVAGNLGANSLQVLRRVYLPLCADMIVWTLMVLIAYDLGAFEVPYLLGSLKPTTLSVQLFSAYLNPSLTTIPLTMAIALLLFLFGLIITGIYGRLIKKLIMSQHYLRRPIGFPKGHQRLTPVLLVVLALVTLVPGLYILLLSVNTFFKYPGLLPTNLTNTYWDNLLFHNTLFFQGLSTSLIIGGLTAIIATLIGFTAARGIVRHYEGNPRWLLVFISLPLLIPGISLFLGAHQVLLHSPLANHWSGVVLAHVLICIPYTLNIALAYFRGIPLELEHAAKTLGTGTRKLYQKVLIPLLLPGLALSLAITFLISNTEYFSTYLIGGGNIITLSMVMFPYIANSDYGMASVTGIIFVLIHLSLFVVIDRLILKRINYKSLHETE